MINFKGIPFFISAVLIFVSCGALTDAMITDDTLKLDRVDYLGDLRLDGYYYTRVPVTGSGDRMDIYFLYTNGIVIYGETPKIENIEDHESKFTEGSYYNRIKNIKYYWGVFTSSTKIIMETWEPSSGGSLKTVIRSGEILNNEMFVITSFLNNYSGETSARNDTFYFKAFGPKPDSTNTFIE